MADVLFSLYVNGLTEDVSIGGSEKIPAGTDASTMLYVTPGTLKTYINTANQGELARTPTATDDIHGDYGGTQCTYTVASISDYVINALEALTLAPAPVGDDHLIFSDNGTLKRGTLTNFMTVINASVLDFSALVAGTPSAGDFFAFDDGAAKGITLANLEAKFWTDFATYVVGETYQSTVTGSDQFYMIDSGTVKYTTADDLKTYIGVNAGDVTGPTTPSTGKIPQWSGTNKALVEGLTLATNVATPGVATKVPTELAVRTAIDAFGDIDNMSAISAIADADLLLVDDGPGTNTKATFTQVWTWLWDKFKAGSDKATPVDADILVIQDSASSNVVAEVTCANLKAYMGIDDNDTTFGSGITSSGADSYVSSVERVGSLYRTTIVIEIDGLNEGDTTNDIIGAAAAPNCHLGQITDATNGTIFAGKIECLEVPAGGNTDIDLWSANEATGVEDTLITGLNGELQLTDHGAWSANTSEGTFNNFPANTQYLYLASGHATPANTTYTSGIFVITLWGK